MFIGIDVVVGYVLVFEFRLIGLLFYFMLFICELVVVVHRKSLCVYLYSSIFDRFVVCFCYSWGGYFGFFVWFVVWRSFCCVVLIVCRLGTVFLVIIFHWL